MAKRKLFFIIHVLVPITVGGLIYICWREPDLLMFRWFRSLGVDSWTNAVRSLVAPGHKLIPYWVAYSLPDGLWVYALTAYMVFVWRKAGSLGTKLIWLSLSLLLGAGAELGQFAGIIPGTFDYADLIVCLAAPTAALLFTSRKFIPGKLISKRSLNEVST